MSAAATSSPGSGVSRPVKNVPVLNPPLSTSSMASPRIPRFARREGRIFPSLFLPQSTPATAKNGSPSVSATDFAVPAIVE